MKNNFPVLLFLAFLFSAPFLFVQSTSGEEAEGIASEERSDTRPLDLALIMERLADEVPQELDTKLPRDYGRSKQEVMLIQVRRKAFALLHEKKFLESIEAFTEVLALEPEDKSTQFGLGTALIENGEYLEAKKLFEEMIERHPADYFIKNNLAWMLATAKNVKFRDGLKAVKLAQEALLVAPGDYHVWSTLSEAYYISGEYAKGLRAAKEALYLGQVAKLKDEKLLIYQEQIDRSSRAALAMSILE